MTDYVPGEGDIEIELFGEGKATMRPTIGACLRISRSDMGEPRELADKCLALNFDAVLYTVAAGLDRKIDDKLTETVFRTGTINLFGACLRFIHVVSNGGRPPKSMEEVVDANPLPSS